MNINNNLYTAIITPMLKNGEIDYHSFKKLLEYQANSECGVLILGSTGEALTLKFKEQCKIVEFVCSLKLKTPIMVGVGGYQLDRQLKWLKFCNKQNIDSFLLVTPIYAKPGTQSQIHWFRSLLDASEKPCIFYNVPSRTGVNLCYDALENIKNHKNAWAIKEASGDHQRFHKYVKIATNLRMYSGEDNMFAELINFGAAGLISVVSNIWAKQVKIYVRESLAKTVLDGSSDLWKKATAACFEVANPIPTKVWLAHNGVISTNTLRPPLLATELASINNLEKTNNLVELHYKDYHI